MTYKNLGVSVVECFGVFCLFAFFFLPYRGWRLWTNFLRQAICSPLRWSFSGLNERSILSLWGPLRGTDENKMVTLTQTRPPFLFWLQGGGVWFCRNEERKTCAIWEDTLLPSAFKSRCFFSLKNNTTATIEKLPSYLSVLIANFKISSNKAGCSWICVSHSERFPRNLLLLTEEPPWEMSKMHKAFEENHASWAGCFWSKSHQLSRLILRQKEA